MSGRRRNKKEGFAFAFVVMALAIILGIFFNYSMSARARKEYMTINKASNDLEESASQSLGTGILDAYIADQMIAKNSESVDDYMGYFLVKDIPENSGAVTQNDAVKVWETQQSSSTGKQNNGPWNKVNKSVSGGRYVADMGAYLDGTWSFSTAPISDNLRVSKGGYFIKKIKNIHSGETLYEADDAGNRTGGKYTADENAIQKELKNYYWDKIDNRIKIPKFEVTMYKNILFQVQNSSKDIARSYDATAKMELYYPPLTAEPLATGIESRSPYPLQRKQTIVETTTPVVGTAVEVTTVRISQDGPTVTSPPIAGNQPFQKSSTINPTVTTQVVSVSNENECISKVSATEKSVESLTGTQETDTILTPPGADFDLGTTENQPVTIVKNETAVGTDEEGNLITTVTKVEETPIVQITEIKKFKGGTLTEKAATYYHNGNTKSCTITTTVSQGKKLVESTTTTKTIGILHVERVTKTANLTPQPSKMASYEIIHVGP